MPGDNTHTRSEISFSTTFAALDYDEIRDSKMLDSIKMKDE